MSILLLKPNDSFCPSKPAPRAFSLKLSLPDSSEIWRVTISVHWGSYILLEPPWLACLTQVGVILEGRWCAFFDFIFLTLSTWLSHNPNSSNVSGTNKVTLRNINKQIPRCTLNLTTFIWSEILTFPPTCMPSVIFNRLQINLADRCDDIQGCGQFWEPTISHTA